MKTINNEAQFVKELSNILSDIIDEILEKCKDVLQEEIDAMDIGNSVKNKVYEPTGEFYKAWKVNAIEKLGNEIFGTMEYDSSQIKTVDPDNFTHGSNYWDGGTDVSNILPDLIFNGESGLFFQSGFWTTPRDAWDSMLKRVNQNIDGWFQTAMGNRGLFVNKGYGLTIS